MTGTPLLVRQIAVGPMANFVYLVVDEKSKEAMAVDSGWETGPIVGAAKAEGAKVMYAVATHGHYDHVTTLGDLAKTLGAKVVAHKDSAIDCDLRVDDGDVLRLGKSEVRVLYTPGHTEDSVCLYDGKEVFTGDTLFVGTIGKFDRAGLSAIYDSLYRIILGLPPSTVMYPGHDYGEVTHRTLAEERTSNPFLIARDFRTFASLFG
jgi:glyoxylase-like metal-dependent hydrolase (beta-lactamase superfamily II)